MQIGRENVRGIVEELCSGANCLGNLRMIIPGMSMEISGQENVWEDVSGENINGNVQIAMQHYKYLSAAVMICVSLVNTHKSQTVFDTGCTISSANCAEKRTQLGKLSAYKLHI